MTEPLSSIAETKIGLRVETLERRLDHCRAALLSCSHVKELETERDRLVERIRESRAAAAVIAEASVKRAATVEEARRRAADRTG